MPSIHSKTSRQRSMEKLPKILPRPTATSLARANLVPGGGGGKGSPVRSRSITTSRRISASSNPKVQTSLAETRRAPPSPECTQERIQIPSSFTLPPATDDENIEASAGVKGSEPYTNAIQKELDAAEQVMQVHSPDVWELNDLKINDDPKDQISRDTLNSENNGETIMPPQSDGLLAEHKKMISQLKEELELKQEMLQGLYSSTQASEGGQECGASEVSATSTAGWSNDLYGTGTCEAEHARTADACLTTLRFRLSEVTACMSDMCQQALTNRELVIDWIFEILDHDELQEDSVHNKMEKFKKFKNEGVSLLDMLEEMKTKAESDVEDAIQLSKQAWSEREAQFAIGETLLGEVVRLRSQIEELQKHIDEADKQPTLPAPHANEDVEKLSHELSQERSCAAELREQLAAAETQLRTAKLRITKLDKQLKETESSLMSLTNTVKSGEDQKRQRDLHIDSRVRKARDALKTSEVTVQQLTQQKETLEKRIAELTENMQTSSERHSDNTATLRGEVASLKASLAAQTRAAEQEAAQRILAEEALTSASAKVHKLQADIESLQQRLPNPDAPTEREIAAWGEAQAAQEALRLLKDELAAARREKKHILETLANITDTGTEVNIQQKLAAELLSKDDLVGSLQNQVHDLTKSCKLNEYKLEQYELHLRDLQLYRAAVVTTADSPQQIDCRDPQQEIISLRMSLVELVHRNEEMMEELRIKESELEQQERSARAQKNVIKAREGLIEMLQKKETAHTEELANAQVDLAQRMEVVDEVSKQIAAKAEEIQQLFASLDHKQQEIQRREKIIRALEEQLRRAQAQRTKLEEKVSTLEHELVESEARRRGQEKKFMFF